MIRKVAVWGGFAMFLVIAASWSLLAASNIHSGELIIGKGFVVSGVKLPEGKYLVVHDDAKLKDGAECTYFYKFPARTNAKPAASVRCKPQTAPRAEALTMSSALQPDGSRIVQSIQFAGSTELHVIQ